jgi:hypothetical protein
MMPNTTLRVEIQIVALALWKCLLRRTRKIVVKRTLILKAKSTTIAMENERPCAAPSVNTAIPHYNQFEIKSSNFNFSSEKQKFYQSVSFTSAGYAAIWLIPKIS